MALYYLGTVVLQMPEADFWRCSLRKLNALLRFHGEAQRRGSFA